MSFLEHTLQLLYLQLDVFVHLVFLLHGSDIFMKPNLSVVEARELILEGVQLLPQLRSHFLLLIDTSNNLYLSHLGGLMLRSLYLLSLRHGLRWYLIYILLQFLVVYVKRSHGLLLCSLREPSKYTLKCSII